MWIKRKLNAGLFLPISEFSSIGNYLILEDDIVYIDVDNNRMLTKINEFYYIIDMTRQLFSLNTSNIRDNDNFVIMSVLSSNLVGSLLRHDGFWYIPSFNSNLQLGYDNIYKSYNIPDESSSPRFYKSETTSVLSEFSVYAHPDSPAFTNPPFNITNFEIINVWKSSSLMGVYESITDISADDITVGYHQYIQSVSGEDDILYTESESLLFDTVWYVIYDSVRYEYTGDLSESTLIFTSTGGSINLEFYDYTTLNKTGYIFDRLYNY